MAENPQQLYKRRVADGSVRPDAGQQRAVQSLQRLHDELINAKNQKSRGWFFKKPVGTPRGVYLYGGVGRGKSMLMDLFYASLPDTFSKRRVHFHAFMIEVHDYIHARRQDDDFDDGIDGVLPALAARIAERSRVLCFDEFHVTDVADAMILGRLFTALFGHGVVVVATSNWPPERLYEGGLQRDRFEPFIDLLKNRLEIVQLDGPIDYRTQLLQTEGTYFWPLGEVATHKANDVFHKLTGGVEATPGELIVKGRAIAVYSAMGVARFTFAQLCENPHGAEDYLNIARVYKTVFLENIPKIGYDRRNEAKRLMILIDALYESRVRLIVTADALPDKLYRGDDHGFEFQRTVSRLQEMQSAAYLGALNVSNHAGL
jgi:cell division protein ZapE